MQRGHELSKQFEDERLATGEAGSGAYPVAIALVALLVAFLLVALLRVALVLLVLLVLLLVVARICRVDLSA